uniref:Uncharacterized protein n=1 Tax=Anguilla anguilla TaxID=7936 RepID=A0A0E9SEG9_ANGAN
MYEMKQCNVNAPQQNYVSTLLQVPNSYEYLPSYKYQNE